MTIHATPDDYRQPWFQWDDRLDLFVLVESWAFTWTEDDEQWRLKIRHGYPTDKSSVPRLLWPIAQPFGECEGAALIHDAGYQQGGIWTPQQLTRWDGTQWVPAYAFDRNWSRQRLDEWYRWHCVLGGLKPWQARVRYWALRAWPPLWGKF